jgi:farnesyl diphosphate synthase
MDDDVLRRGKPTCHVAFGEAMALLAGDALQSAAFEALATGGLRDAREALLTLAEAAGSRGMAGGQAIDLACVDKTLDLSELERMHRLKTGALIRAAVRLGADCGRPTDADGNDALHRYASAIGLAFQVVDDVLDVEGTAQSLGKTAGKDAVQRKSTYATLLGLTAARERIETLRVEARDALVRFGARARRLEELADWIAARTH